MRSVKVQANRLAGKLAVKIPYTSLNGHAQSSTYRLRLQPRCSATMLCWYMYSNLLKEAVPNTSTVAYSAVPAAPAVKKDHCHGTSPWTLLKLHKPFSNSSSG